MYINFSQSNIIRILLYYLFLSKSQLSNTYCQRNLSNCSLDSETNISDNM